MTQRTSASCFQSCILNGLAILRNQAEQGGYQLNVQVQNKFLSQVTTSNQNKQMVSAQFESAREQYNAAHERSPIP